MRKIFLVSRCAWTMYNFRLGLIRYLSEHGDRVITAGGGGDGYDTRLRERGVTFVDLPVNRRALHPLADARLFWRLFQWYRREKPDVVHHFTIKPVIYGSVAARLAGVPRIVNTVTGLGYVFSGAAPGWLTRLVELQYRLALHCADFTFFQNEDDRSLFVHRGLVNEKRCGLLAGSGVDLAHFRPQERRADQPLTVLMVARVLRDKGLYEYVDAARLLRQEFPDTRFVLLGARDERNPSVVPADDLARWQRDRLIAWLGEVPDVRGIMSDSDIVVLPSYREGTPRSLLEAAAMGKPIVTTNITGCREVVEHQRNGLLVPVKDARALAEAIRQLLLDAGLRARMGEEGRRKMHTTFDERLVIERVVSAYEG